jgi:hypothetical protein
MIERLLKTWRWQIPAMQCAAGCRDCCEGDARTMLLAEWREIKHPGKYSAGQVFAACPFLEETGCAIYARRPLVCRVFGTVSRQDPELPGLDVPIFCPRGCEPERPLSFAAALKMQVKYGHFALRELQRVVTDWLKYLPQAKVGERLPEKFLWLRYVLSTREGQTSLRMLWGTMPVKIEAARMERMAALVGG